MNHVRKSWFFGNVKRRYEKAGKHGYRTWKQFLPLANGVLTVICVNHFLARTAALLHTSKLQRRSPSVDMPVCSLSNLFLFPLFLIMFLFMLSFFCFLNSFKFLFGSNVRNYVCLYSVSLWYFSIRSYFRETKKPVTPL